MGDFDPITQDFLDVSFQEQSALTGGLMGTGLEVKPIDTNVIGVWPENYDSMALQS